MPINSCWGIPSCRNLRKTPLPYTQKQLPCLLFSFPRTHQISCYPFCPFEVSIAEVPVLWLLRHWQWSWASPSPLYRDCKHQKILRSSLPGKGKRLNMCSIWTIFPLLPHKELGAGLRCSLTIPSEFFFQVWFYVNSNKHSQIALFLPKIFTIIKLKSSSQHASV